MYTTSATCKPQLLQYGTFVGGVGQSVYKYGLDNKELTNINDTVSLAGKQQVLYALGVQGESWSMNAS